MLATSRYLTPVAEERGCQSNRHIRRICVQARIDEMRGAELDAADTQRDVLWR